MNRLPLKKRVEILGLLVDGNSLRATTRLSGVSINTVSKLLADFGCACAEYHEKHVRNVSTKRVQCDEIWSFVGSKAKNISSEKEAKGFGDVWTWAAIDADSKLIISYMLGDRGAKTAHTFMQDLSQRVSTSIQITRDGHRIYANAVEDAFGMEVDYAMLVKIYGASSMDESRYSPATCSGCRTGILAGNPDPKHISTSFVERQNQTMRMGMRRFTRPTNAFSKKLANHGHAIAIHFLHYNFARVHKSLLVTPAMEAGLTDHVWSLEEIALLAA